MAPRNAYFLLYEDVETLDFTGPYDVLSMTMVTQKNAGRPDPFVLKTVSRDGCLVQALHGLKIQPDASFEDLQDAPIDLLFIPGGNVGDPEYLQKLQPEIEWIRQRSPETEITATICVGALLAAAAGLFGPGMRVTTHHGFLRKLAELAPKAEVIAGARYTDACSVSNMMTSAGVSAGMDLTVYMVEMLLGQAAAQATVDIMEYNRTVNWAPAG